MIWFFAYSKVNHKGAESCVLLTWIFAILAGSGDVSGSGFSEMFFYGAGSRAVYADRI